LAVLRVAPSLGRAVWLTPHACRPPGGGADGCPTHRHRLSLTLRLNGQDYVALLVEWNPPPTIDDVEAALRRVIGRSIQDVGEVDVGDERARPFLDEHGY
jgi:hypothetical protein